MAEPILITPYDPHWTEEFRDIGTRLRHALQDVALRIDHIGSTSVIELDAKPIIDIQISVSSFEPLQVYQEPMQNIGYVFRSDNPERTKRYFRESEGMRRTHIHVREQGSFGEQFALLFRDYLRQHANEAKYYAAIKYKLKDQYEQDRHHYVEAKEPFIWEIMRRASEWSQQVGWKPGQLDV
ncbi:hypothetical protein BVG16_26910 [Paenibacillus selenitireducens]|uniref:GrpB family protein n=1 Tax=Paenibacillus selenitireducens TaxID=1324314 RepID=A0A1T2X1I2_9BACL|nr:GrpB family protein [Paenibacillus selenitireducens]OPA73724.1 hypothetical protein BVG16_26910 [Paenibacillus selenitireducens]